MKRTVIILAMLPVLMGGSCEQMITQRKAAIHSQAARAVRPDPDAVASQSEPTAPPPLSLALLQRGQQRFQIYCTPCHSELGDGDGMVVQRGFPHPPSYEIDRLRSAPTQHFFDVMTHGLGDMYSFAGRISSSDRWAIASYIRALQLSQHAAIASLPDAQRQALP
jgi:mono/diheme cytochrome c family protein